MVRWSVLATPLAVLALASPAAGHPMPFSTLDLRVDDRGVTGSLTVHAFDLAHELGVSPPERLLDPAEARRRSAAIGALLAGRLEVHIDGRPATPAWSPAEVLPERQALRLSLGFDEERVAPGVLVVQGLLFPYDGNHQTFVNLYEGDRLVSQAIIDQGHPRLEHFTGTSAGRWAVMNRFVAAGVHHILVGLDHVLFLVGLLLLGGSLRQLVWLVSAFTLGHSLTLSLAALGLLNPPARVVEPAIALSIVFVGADNLLADRGARDLRPWIALVFGLVHGFGFAGVLREMGLPGGGLAWALFSFNVGVEIGQVLAVVVVAVALAALRSRSERTGRWLTQVGSVVVAAAGAFWFVQRLFFAGGTS